MSGHDAAWDEDRGGTRDPLNLISFPMEGKFYKSTKKVLEWQPCGSHDQGRVVIPAVHVERLFRKAPVPDPRKLHPLKMITRCLDVNNYLAEALDLLIDEGLLTELDEDDNEQDKIFETIDDLMEAADKLVCELRRCARSHRPQTMARSVLRRTKLLPAPAEGRLPATEDRRRPGLSLIHI